MRLFINGHAAGKGYAIDIEWTDAEIRILPHLTDPYPPIRMIRSRDKAFELVKRFNRRFSTH